LSSFFKREFLLKKGQTHRQTDRQAGRQAQAGRHRQEEIFSWANRNEGKCGFSNRSTFRITNHLFGEYKSLQYKYVFMNLY
jgi:hypothetical protein